MIFSCSKIPILYALYCYYNYLRFYCGKVPLLYRKVFSDLLRYANSMRSDRNPKILISVIILCISAWINQDFSLAMGPVTNEYKISSNNSGLTMQDVELTGKDIAWLGYERFCTKGSFTLSFKLENLTETMYTNTNINGLDHYAIGFINVGNGSLFTYLSKQKGTGRPSSIQKFLGRSLNYNQTQEYYVKITSEGGHIQVFVDKVGQQKAPMQVIDYYDPEPLPAGKINFETFESSSSKLSEIKLACSSMNEEPPNLGVGYFKPPG
jgi:hypothetical protein